MGFCFVSNGVMARPTNHASLDFKQTPLPPGHPPAHADMITPEIEASMESSVLCWLATVSAEGVPNVSPKEAWLHDGQGKILVAHIASPKTVRNIEENSQVCLSFINIFTQKGYQISGRASICRPGESGYEAKLEKVVQRIGTVFPVLSIIVIEPVRIQTIIAPSYTMFPASGAEDRIRESLATYRVEDYIAQVKQPSSDT